MRTVHLLGTTAIVALLVSACGEVATKECTITTDAQRREGKVVTARFDINVNCEDMRRLAEQGQPLPTIGAVASADDPQKPQTAPPAPIDVTTAPTVPGQNGGQATLIPATNKAERKQELIANLPSLTDARDPFLGISGTVPSIPDLKPKVVVVPTVPEGVNVTPMPVAPPPPPPDTSAARAVNVTGVFNAGGTDFVILQSPTGKGIGYVRVGEKIPGTEVTVSSVSSSGDKVTVVLVQNGVQVPKEVSLTTLTAPRSPA